MKVVDSSSDFYEAGGIVSPISGENKYTVLNPATGQFDTYQPIYGYRNHYMLLSNAKEIFCPDCGVQSQCEDDYYPYVKMLHDLPDECE